MGFAEYLRELKEMNLPPDQYAIFGSGPMAVRGIRESRDLDVIVKPELWMYLSGRHYVKKGVVKKGDIEFYKDWSEPFIGKVETLIREAEIIDGTRFVKLQSVIEWKRLRNKEKDVKDLELIRKYLVGTNFLDKVTQVDISL